MAGIGLADPAIYHGDPIPADLGTPATGGRLAIAVNTAWARLSRASARAKRYGQVARRRSVPSFFNLAIQPAIAYGSQATGVAESSAQAGPCAAGPWIRRARPVILASLLLAMSPSVEERGRRLALLHPDRWNWRVRWEG